MEIILKILMCISFITFIIWHVYEIIRAQKFYKNCENTYNDFIEKLINDFKKEDDDTNE